MDFHFEECDQQDPHKDDEAMTMSSTTDKKDGRALERENSLAPKTRRLLGEIFFEPPSLMLLLENCKIMVVLVVGTEKKFEMKMGVFHGLLTDFNLKD